MAARAAGLLGLTVTAYRDLCGTDWFVPAAYSEPRGFERVNERDTEILLCQPFTADAQPPRFLRSHHSCAPVEGRVADLFRNGFRQASSIEAERVHAVCGELGDVVLLNEYCAEDRHVLLCHRIPRAILVNGNEIDWGPEAPKDGIRTAIRRAMPEPI
ncbi:hypothetical protein ACFLSF_00490 [Candidatus Bipolaricaulota bacterium]